MMDIYTTKDHLNFRKQCSALHFGQLLNDKLHINLDVISKRSGCEMSNGMTTCKGTRTIQDYIPRHYYASYGFDCHRIGSLQGVKYNISIYGQTNETYCQPISRRSHCSNYHPKTTFPNLVGVHDVDAASNFVDQLQSYLYFAKIILKEYCHKNIDEFICNAFLSECRSNGTRTDMVAICREFCLEFIDACYRDVIKLLENNSSSSLLEDLKSNLRYLSDNIGTLINCNHLPSVNGTIPCFYKPVTCDSPPNVTNAVIQMNNTDRYPLHFQLQYSCADEKQIVGNNTIKCLYSGQWSKPPRCVRKSKSVKNPLLILVPVLAIPLILLVLFLVYLSKKRVQLTPLFRKRMYDAYVCYDFDSDDQFVTERILPALEQQQDHPFQLCIHSRDFTPGSRILSNIHEAIENSNSAIIIMSQAFIYSEWCKYEFEQCFIENMNDPAFKLLVIMMQPANNLKDMSRYMKSFFNSKTYLDVKDPKLFQKIASYLTRVKQPKNNSDEYLQNEKQNEAELGRWSKFNEYVMN